MFAAPRRCVVELVASVLFGLGLGRGCKTAERELEGRRLPVLPPGALSGQALRWRVPLVPLGRLTGGAVTQISARHLAARDFPTIGAGQDGLELKLASLSFRCFVRLDGHSWLST